MFPSIVFTLILAISEVATIVSARGLFAGSEASGLSRRAGCPTLHMIVARASTEAPGQGIIGAVAKDVQGQFQGADSEAVNYPASLGNYASSEAQGVSDMTSKLNAFVAKCPSTPVVLMGYSQGAQVSADTISGGATGISGSARNVKALSSAATQQIAAVVLMGDPSFVPGKQFNVGSNTAKNGVFPRKDTSALDAISGKVQSFCENGDTFCASGNSLATHLGYVNELGSQAADFIVSKAA